MGQCIYQLNALLVGQPTCGNNRQVFIYRGVRLFRNYNAAVFIAVLHQNALDFGSGMRRFIGERYLGASLEIYGRLDTPHPPSDHARHNNQGGYAQPEPRPSHHAEVPRAVAKPVHLFVACKIEVNKGKEESARNGDGRKHTYGHAKAKRQREATNRPCTEVVEHATGDDRTDVRVEDGREGAIKTGINSGPQRLPRPQLLFKALENKNVGIYRHSDG